MKSHSFVPSSPGPCLRRGAVGRAVAAQAAPAELPHVVILATGGTIAGVQPKEGDPGYKSGSLSDRVAHPGRAGLDKIARLDGEQIAWIGSQDMNDAVWFKLARRVNELLAKPDVDGIVITHGTDTLEETAYFLDLVVKSDKPVVLVGSMRPATSTSPDGPLNLYNARGGGRRSRGQGLGVLVVVNDDLHAARDIQKTNTTDVQTFISPNRGPIGEAYYGKTGTSTCRPTATPRRASSPSTGSTRCRGSTSSTPTRTRRRAGARPRWPPAPRGSCSPASATATRRSHDRRARRGREERASWSCAAPASGAASSAATSS